MTTTVESHFDPPLTLDEIDAQIGPDVRRLAELCIVDAVIANNASKVRALVARSLGYDELAERFDALAELRRSLAADEVTTYVGPVTP